MFHDHLDYFQKPPLGGRPNTKPGDHGTPNTHNCWCIILYHVWGSTWIEIHWAFGWGPSHIWLHTTLEGPWPHYMILEICQDGLWTLCFGLSQLHGHGSCPVCEAALTSHGPPCEFFLWERTSISRQVEHRHRFVSFGFHISVTYIPAAFKKVHLFVGHCCQGLYKLVYACVNDGTICMVFMWVSQVPHWSTWLQLNMHKIEVLYGDDTSRIVPTFASHNVITNILNLH